MAEKDCPRNAYGLTGEGEGRGSFVVAAPLDGFGWLVSGVTPKIADKEFASIEMG
ncbi:MAG: hypothetical protein ACUVV5_12745 [Candidatus Aminicenantales bacterium]